MLMDAGSDREEKSRQKKYVGCEFFCEATAAVFRIHERGTRRRLGTKKMGEALWEASRDAESLNVGLFLEMQCS